MHHCVVDGIGGTDLLAEIFDPPPDAGPPVQPAAGEPQRGPAPVGTMPSGLSDAVAWPLRLAAGVPDLVRQQTADRPHHPPRLVSHAGPAG